MLKVFPHVSTCFHPRMLLQFIRAGSCSQEDCAAAQSLRSLRHRIRGCLEKPPASGSDLGLRGGSSTEEPCRPLTFVKRKQRKQRKEHHRNAIGTSPVDLAGTWTSKRARASLQIALLCMASHSEIRVTRHVWQTSTCRGMHACGMHVACTRTYAT